MSCLVVLVMIIYVDNNADNELRGGDGWDKLWGFKGDDVLVGGMAKTI